MARRVRLGRYIGEGEIIPRGYRVAYRDFSRRCYIVYPIGLHWLARAIRRIWEWTVRYWPSRMELMMERLYKQGRLDERQIANKEIELLRLQLLVGSDIGENWNGLSFVSRHHESDL